MLGNGFVGRPPYELRCCCCPESEYELGSAEEFGLVMFGEFRTLADRPRPSNIDVRSPPVLVEYGVRMRLASAYGTSLL